MENQIEILASQYLSLKAQLKELEAAIKSSMNVKRGKLVVEKKTGKHYRAKYVFINDDTGLPYLTVSKIRNERIGWESVSVPRLHDGEFDIVDWQFDHAEADRMREVISKTDSIAAKETAQYELVRLYRSCFHNWERARHGDGYYCTECGCGTETVETKDWLNGTSEHQNIAIDI